MGKKPNDGGGLAGVVGTGEVLTHEAALAAAAGLGGVVLPVLEALAGALGTGPAGPAVLTKVPTPLMAAQLQATGETDVIVEVRAPSAAASIATTLSSSIGVPVTPAQVARVASGLAKCFRPSTRGGAALSMIASSLSAKPAPMHTYENLGLIVGTVDQSGLEELRKSPEVAAIGAAPRISLIWPPTVGASLKHKAQFAWGLTHLKVKEMWDRGFDGTGVTVGHLDTGVDDTHPVLRGAVKSFLRTDWDGNPAKNQKPADTDNHGTHTAGTIVGRGYKGLHVGVAPGAMLASAEVIEGGDPVKRVLAGLNWMLGQGVQIVNLSLGFRGYWPDFEMVVRALRARGVLPVIATGNEGPMTSRSPGNYQNVLSVGAIDRHNRVAWFSSSERFPRPVNPLVPLVVGPGVEVLSCVPGNGYMEMPGTSMATPHISGLAALLVSAAIKQGVTVSVAQLEQAIVASASLPAGMDGAQVAHGLPDVAKAFQLLFGKQLSMFPVSATTTAGKSRTVRKKGLFPKKKASKKAKKTRG